MNTPFSPPRLPAGKAFPIQRSPFLNGELFTLFMPGQSVGRQDDPPTEWPRKGQLLRVPKCVFLSSVPPARLYGDNFSLVSQWWPLGYYGHHYDATPRLPNEPRTEVPYGSLVFNGFVGTYHDIRWTIDPRYDESYYEDNRRWRKQAVIPNAIKTEHERLLTVFAEAKQILESRGYFVQICEFFPSNPLLAHPPYDEFRPMVLDLFSQEGIEANTPRHFANGPLWILGPDSYPAEFFGTHFTHIYCGYQSTDGILLPDTFFRARSGPSHSDLIDRVHWKNRFGYNFEAANLLAQVPWEVLEDDGYLETDWITAYIRRLMNQVTEDTPAGKFAMLAPSHNQFASYRTLLHNYDPPWNFPGKPSFNNHLRPGDFPPYVTRYDEQDWVEQVIILGCGQRRDNDENPYGDRHYMCGSPDAYNFTVRYPSEEQYRDQYLPWLHHEFDTFKEALLSLTPKTREIWETLIDENNLNDYGIKYVGGSSEVTVDYIVDSVG